MAVHENERDFEKYIRGLIKELIIPKNSDLLILDNKKAVDILICREGHRPALFFLEIKFHQNSHGRLGFGGSGGGGFQPEIVGKNPTYFESNLRWILGHQESNDEGVLFLPSSVVQKYLSGGAVGQKFNNIQKKIFKEQTRLTEPQLVNALEDWLKS